MVAIDPQHLLDKYKRYLTDTYVRDNPAVRWCARPGCNLALDTGAAVYGMVECKCGYKACVSCDDEGHAPATCDMVRWHYCNAHVRWRAGVRNVRTIVRHTTGYCPIPRSVQNVEVILRRMAVAVCINRSYFHDVDHMTCRQCKHEFCWICDGAWKSHTDSYSCNRFKATAEAEKDEHKLKLERYVLVPCYLCS